MINNSFENICLADLQSLIENQVLESKSLDYKEVIKIYQNEDKKEFLADVSSFANSSGGDIIFGVKEDKGIPTELIGIESPMEKIDSLKLQIESSIRDGIEPRIPGIKTKEIPLENGRFIIVLRIPKSWRSPHCVTFSNFSRFFARGSNGKYQLDVSELRTAFNLSETLNEKIKNFREDRIAKIYADEGFLKQGNSAKIAVHIIPLNAFDPSVRHSIDELKAAALNSDNRNRMLPINSIEYTYKINFEGLNIYTNTNAIGTGNARTYLQIFTNGIIEAVDMGMLNINNKEIYGAYIEDELIKSINYYLNFINRINIELPYIVFISLVGINGYSMRVAQTFFSHRQLIDRDVLLLPEVFLEEYSIESLNLRSILRSTFDSLWNACGYIHSLNYDDNGNFVGKQ